MNVTEKILKSHMLEGEMIKGTEIGIRIDQTLTQDSTGTMAYLQLEGIGIDKVKTDLSVAYIDHNMLQEGFENADDHLYIQTVTNKHGVYFSRPGNGICHQVHLERFGVCGKTLLGSDSHTPTCGALGMIAIGAGGLDVAVAMAGGTYYLTMPEIVNVKLTGKLNKFVTAKDIILKVLEILSVKGGVGRVIEYSGDALKNLSIPERATITNMGAELGATTSVFPSDEVTKEFLKAQEREKDFTEIKADADAVYDKVIEINLDELTPLLACPHSPDSIKSVTELEGKKINQVAIGSCTNSSYKDMMTVARILKDKTVAENVSLVISPGSKQVLSMLAENGALADMLKAGVRILESGCGPCIGMGQAPATDAVSLRTFNRNFKGRSGTKSADVYLVSPELAAYSAIMGEISDPRNIEEEIKIEQPKNFLINDNMVIKPNFTGDVVRGPNIKPFPLSEKLQDSIAKKALLKVEDNITTDHIMPSNAKLLPFRSNIPYLADFCLTPCDANFPKRAKENNGGFIIAGENYGQGSSREHAALAPLYLNIKGVIAKSFARIHKANLINSGILPLVFINKNDYDKINLMDDIIIEDLLNQIKNETVTCKNATSGFTFEVSLDLSEKERDMIIAGGKINYLRG